MDGVDEVEAEEGSEVDSGGRFVGSGWSMTGSAPPECFCPSGRLPLRRDVSREGPDDSVGGAPTAMRWRSLARSTMTSTGMTSAATKTGCLPGGAVPSLS